MTWSRPLAVIRVFEQCAYGRFFDGAWVRIRVLRSDLGAPIQLALRHADIFQCGRRAQGCSQVEHAARGIAKELDEIAGGE